MGDEKIKSYGSASGATQIYAVEARINAGEPRLMAGNWVTEKWRHIVFARAAIGVPSYDFHAVSERYLTGLYSYEAALALAHWFLASPDESKGASPFMGHPLCVEARLVQVELKYSYSTEERGVGETISHFDMRRAAKFNSRVPPAPLRGEGEGK